MRREGIQFPSYVECLTFPVDRGAPFVDQPKRSFYRARVRVFGRQKWLEAAETNDNQRRRVDFVRRSIAAEGTNDNASFRSQRISHEKTVTDHRFIYKHAPSAVDHVCDSHSIRFPSTISFTVASTVARGPRRIPVRERWEGRRRKTAIETQSQPSTGIYREKTNDSVSS